MKIDEAKHLAEVVRDYLRELDDVGLVSLYSPALLTDIEGLIDRIESEQRTVAAFNRSEKQRTQISYHGAGRYSKQVFGASGELVSDENVPNGWKGIEK